MNNERGLTDLHFPRNNVGCARYGILSISEGEKTYRYVEIYVNMCIASDAPQQTAWIAEGIGDAPKAPRAALERKGFRARSMPTVLMLVLLLHRNPEIDAQI